MTNNYLSIDQLKRALEIEEQIQKLRLELDSVLSGTRYSVSAPAAKTVRASAGGDGRKGKRSAATRAKMAAAQKARWAKKNGGAPANEVAAETPTKTKKKKRQMSEEGRARIIAAQKKRWAALKASKKS